MNQTDAYGPGSGSNSPVPVRMFLDDNSGIALWMRGHVLPPWNDAVLPVPAHLRQEVEAWIDDGTSLLTSSGLSRAAHINHDLAGAHLAMRLQESVGDGFLIVYDFETDEAYERYDESSPRSS